MSVVLDEGADVEHRAEAMHLLGIRHPFAEMGPALQRGLDSKHSALQVAATLIVHRQGDTRFAGKLVSLLTSENEEVQMVAANALAKLGSLDAVESLLPLTEGLTRSPEVKAAARDAVRAIQQRAGSPTGGGLSVVDDVDRAGGLSLPRQEGAVSLVDESSPTYSKRVKG